ncbi:MAG: acetyl-CoA hydrolase/transferase C-terminal domain-containing protein [Pseudomonadota bacterium]
MDSWQDVIADLKRGERVFVAGCAGEPGGFAKALSSTTAAPSDLTFVTVPLPGINATDWSALSERAVQETIFLTPALREGFAAGRVRFTPAHYSTTFRRLCQPGSVDVAVVRVPPPADDGTVGLGTTADFAPAAIAAGARLYGAVDEHLPDPPDAPRYEVARFHRMVEDGTAALQYRTSAVNPATAMIGQRIADLIAPGDTVQLGLGRVQPAVLTALSDHRDLALHGGMIADATVDPAESGVFSRDITTGFAAGTEKLNEYLQSQPPIGFRDVGYTHGVATIIGMPRFVAVNSVVCVDLFGQAVADMIDGRQISGHGGLVDFVRGANLSAGGRAILALPATAGASRRSRIVPRIEGAVTVPRGDTHIIVTEHGARDVSSLDIDARAEAIIGLAAPTFRDDLANAWASMRAAM